VTDVLLDTSAYSAHRRGHVEIAATIQAARSVAINAVALGELLRGFRSGGRFDKNLRDLDRFRSSPRFRLLAVDEDTADCYSRIVIELRKMGTPIPSNDAWIAASALQHGLEILTTDPHFRRVPMLSVRCFGAL